MAEAASRSRLEVETYLQGELNAEQRHEYLAGEVYAMVGASDAHNIITLNLASALHAHLKGGPCRAFMSDMKLRLRAGEEDYFYYPDVMVACQPGDAARYYREQPIFLAEVTSETTERIDRREKLFAYRGIAALEEYLLLAQDSVAATLYRRAAGWSAVRLGAQEELNLASLNLRLPLHALYDGVAGL